MKFIFTTLFIFITFGSYAQKSEEFNKYISDTYNFKPHKLTQKQIDSIIPTLDKFFEKVKSDTSTYLPLLREELKSTEHFPYYYYDCAHLLILTSKLKSDNEMAVDAFAKSYIGDLNSRVYLSIIISLAKDGINVTKAAAKILEDSTFHFYLYDHGAFDFTQGLCLTYSLLHLDPNLYVDTLINRFKAATYTKAQYSIITTLWFAYSCRGDSFLRTLDKSNTLESNISDYAKRILKYNHLDIFYTAMYWASKPKNWIEIKSDALNRYSDEAVSELDFVTVASRRKLKCR